MAFSLCSSTPTWSEYICIPIDIHVWRTNSLFHESLTVYLDAEETSSPVESNEIRFSHLDIADKATEIAAMILLLPRAGMQPMSTNNNSRQIQANIQPLFQSQKVLGSKFYSPLLRDTEFVCFIGFILVDNTAYQRKKLRRDSIDGYWHQIKWKQFIEEQRKCS